MFKIFSSVCLQLSKIPLLLFFIYVIGFVLAFVVALPFYSTLISEANGSMGLDILVSKFDFMYFSDFLRVSGKAFKHFLGLIFLLGVIYIFLNIYFSGGILDSLKNKSFKFSRFFSACNIYFVRFTLLYGFTFLLLLIFFGISCFFFFLFTRLAQGGNERTYFFAMLSPIGIMLNLIGFVMVQNDYGKVILVENPSIKPAVAFWKSIGFVWRNPSTLAAFWIIVFVGFLFALVYLCLDSIIGMHSGITIFVMFVIQQLLVFSRTFLKILTLGYAIEFYSSKGPLAFSPVSLNLGENLNLDEQTAV